jgi:glutamate-1-semialdehyde 2,1-aminomutase
MTEKQYAISEYPDTIEIYARLKNLIDQPIHPIRSEKMQAYLIYFETQCTRSKALNEDARMLIPGGVQHNLAFNYPFPIAIEKADGAFLWDVDGNRYIDFLQAGGATLLGSNYPSVRARVIEMLQTCGPVTGLFHEYELKLAQLIHRFMPHAWLRHGGRHGCHPGCPGVH